MKKYALVCLAFVPIPVGWLINSACLIPTAGVLITYVARLLMLVFWFYLGSRFAGTDWKAVSSVLIGNAAGILSLALYLWQFWGCSDENRNLALAGLSQMYSLAAPLNLSARLAMLFESQPGYAGITTMLAMQVIALLIMAAVFTGGYFWGRKRIRGGKSLA